MALFILHFLYADELPGILCCIGPLHNRPAMRELPGSHISSIYTRSTHATVSWLENQKISTLNRVGRKIGIGLDKGLASKRRRRDIINDTNFPLHLHASRNLGGLIMIIRKPATNRIKHYGHDKANPLVDEKQPGSQLPISLNSITPTNVDLSSMGFRGTHLRSNFA